MVVRKKLVLNLEFVAFTLQCLVPDDGVVGEFKGGVRTVSGHRVDQRAEHQSWE